MNTAKTLAELDKNALESKVKYMYEAVANHPEKEYHFEMGRELALRLGYDAEDLDNIPAEAIASFAGVGCYFPLADIKLGEKVIDLGSGSGMDAFIANLKSGNEGQIIGIDMTQAQLDKSEKLAAENQIKNVSFINSYIENLPLDDNEVDVVISNGVINLSAEKGKVFSEITRILKRGGRMAISDIVTESHMPASITCSASLWAACIGGAMQEDEYFKAIEKADLKIIKIVQNPEYQFISKSAISASRKYGVKSISVLAEKI